MAYVDGEWLDRAARQRRINELTEENAILIKIIAGPNGTNYDIDKLEANEKLLDKLNRVHECEFDLLRFTYEYFSVDLNPDNETNLIPSGQSIKNAAEFHETLCALLDDITCGNQTSNVAWSVGRRHAKTAYLSNSFLSHQVVYRHQKYIIEISETTDVAGDFIRFTQQNLKFNQKLRDDFGPLLHPKPSMNEVDNKYEFITSSGTKVEGKGMGTQMRGLRHLTERPGLFLLDDLESNANTNTPELRQKNLHWFRSEMLEALGFGGIAVYMGTILGYDSLLNHVINHRKDFVSKKFPAILSWSEREDLWEDWRKIYNEDSKDAKQKADGFYEANKDEMDRGTEVLWPQMYTYKYFMEKRESMGTKAFNQEYLGNPVDEESQIFKPEEFTYYTDNEISDKPIEYYCGVDFAMGKEKGDYSAIITVGKSPNGVFYVVDTFLERVHPDVLLNKVVEKALKYQYEAIAVEAQMAQEWFADKLSDELRASGYPASTRLKQVKQRTRKALRIESLLPETQNGKIRFKREQRLLLEMFEMYPNHNHDDGPDGLHLAVTAVGKKKASITTSAKRMR
jgi:predicted phage terminase large subunit-like protein